MRRGLAIEFLQRRRDQAEGLWAVFWDALADADDGRSEEALQKLGNLVGNDDAEIAHAAATQHAEIEIECMRTADALRTIQSALERKYSIGAALLEASLLVELGRREEAHDAYAAIVTKLTPGDHGFAQIVAAEFGGLLNTLRLDGELSSLEEELLTLYPSRRELSGIFKRLRAGRE